MNLDSYSDLVALFLKNSQFWKEQFEENENPELNNAIIQMLEDATKQLHTCVLDLQDAYDNKKE